MAYRIVKYLATLFFVYVLFMSAYLYNQNNATKQQSYDEDKYYIVFDYNKENEAILLDENNVTYIDYSKVKSLSVGNKITYNPVTVSLFALRYYQDNKFDYFIAHADWLVDNIKDDGSLYINHDKYIGRYKLTAPWRSALSQGIAISVLTRAYNLTKKFKYISAARRAVEPFNRGLLEGGVCSHNDFGDFYEEYPVVAAPTHVLNGFMYSLFGLYDLYKYDNNLEAKKLFDNGVATLKNVLHKYDLNHWSRYDLNSIRNFKNHWGYSSPWYQKLHVAQLYGLYKITNEHDFLEYSNKFEEQERGGFINIVIYPAYILYTDFVRVYKVAEGLL